MENEADKKPAIGWPSWLFCAAIVLFALAVFIPNFVKSRTLASYKSCSTVRHEIDAAVQQWALENKKIATDTYSLTDPALLKFLKGSVLPMCPQGGRYLPGTNVTQAPRCTIRGHAL